MKTTSQEALSRAKGHYPNLSRNTSYFQTLLTSNTMVQISGLRTLSHPIQAAKLTTHHRTTQILTQHSWYTKLAITLICNKNRRNARYDIDNNKSTIFIKPSHGGKTQYQINTRKGVSHITSVGACSPKYSSSQNALIH